MYAIQANKPLQKLNTFGINISSKYFIKAIELADIQSIISNYIFNFEKVVFLGSGSNILFTKDVDGLVIKNEIQGIHCLAENDTNVTLQVMSGTIWHDVVCYAVSHNYGGIENLALIPGTAGAAPIQNIGAYGCELKDVLVEVSAIDLHTAEERTFSNVQCEFGYRDSIFKREAKNKYFITSITLQLQKMPSVNTRYGDIQKVLDKKNISNPTIADVADAVIGIRNAKLPNPKVLGNAGSFFKNPVISLQHFEKLQTKYPDIPHYASGVDKIKIPAAWLIEQCGWKGKIVGNTGNHAAQPLVIVNYGNATGKEILYHAEQVQASVQETFDIEMEMEVNIM